MRPLLVMLVATMILAGYSVIEIAVPRHVSLAAAKAPARSRVIVMVMENQSYTDVIGSPSAPYLNALGRRYAVPAAMFGITHPSLPNYLALTGGDTFGVRENCTGCRVGAKNLVDQLERNRFSWKAYMQGMPRPCYRGASAGTYVKKHNPFMYYDNIRNNPRRCGKIVPMTRLAGDMGRKRLPDFVWITPDLCDGMHDCGVAAGDRFAKKLVPSLLRQLGPAGLLIVTWDEGRTDRGCCGGHAAGGRIPTIVAGPGVVRGATGAGEYNLYSVLRTIEDAFGLPPLRHAASAFTLPLHSLFKSHPRVSRR
jgi:phosphatidylinositol-3-phosphatase